MEKEHDMHDELPELGLKEFLISLAVIGLLIAWVRFVDPSNAVTLVVR